MKTKPSKSGALLDAETWDALKASGYTEDELLAEQPFGPIICSYTRAQAIEDGMLVDLMQPGTVDLVKEAGFRIPVAMTATAFSEAVCPIGGDRDLPPGQSLTGRLWDVLFVLRYRIREANRRGDTNRVHFKVRVWRGDGKSEVVRLWCLCGPGDDAEPVLTIMLEGED